MTKTYSYIATNPNVYDIYFLARLLHYNMIDSTCMYFGYSDVTRNDTIDGRYIFHEYEEYFETTMSLLPIGKLTDSLYDKDIVISSLHDVDMVAMKTDNFYIFAPDTYIKPYKSIYNVLNESDNVYDLITELYNA